MSQLRFELYQAVSNSGIEIAFDGQNMPIASETSDMRGKSKSYAKPIGVVVTTIAYLMLLRLMMLSSSGNLDVSEMEGAAFDAYSGAVPSFNVTLNPSASPTAAPAAKSPSPFKRFEKLADASAEAIAPAKLEAPKPSQSLTKALGEDVFTPTPKLSGAKTDAKEAHIEANGQTTQSLNDLWKAIEPCWRRNATKDTQSVSLVVSFSPLGNLSKPPVIDRPMGMNLDTQRLRSEAQAINALSQCGPYLMAFGQQNVTVRFPARS